MENYSFNGAKYMTKGICEGLPAVLVMYLWECIKERKKDKAIPMDYLQVFTLSCEIENKRKILIIKQRQEVPPYQKMYKLHDFAKVGGRKIFVIDSGDYVTMMFADEY